MNWIIALLVGLAVGLIAWVVLGFIALLIIELAPAVKPLAVAIGILAGIGYLAGGNAPWVRR